MAQSDLNTKRLTSEQKHTQQLVTNLKKKYTKEFAAVPYDGVIVAMNKIAFAKTTAIDSLIYELTSFNGTSGSGLLQYMTPGSIIPLYPSAVHATSDEVKDVEVNAGHRFMDKVFILSGAEYVDKTQQLIPNVHKYDEIISSMARGVRNVKSDRDFNSFANNVGADILDTSSEDALTSKHVADIFEKFFPEIEKNERREYVLYVACRAKVAVDYVLSNLEILDDIDREKSSSPLVSPKTMRVIVDNERLCKEAPTYCRMLVCRENEVMLKPDNVEKYYGTDFYVSDPVLKNFNNTLKNGMTFDEKRCHKIPVCKFLVSMMASSLLYEYPIPAQLFSLRERSTEMLAERLMTIVNIYFKNKPISENKMSMADQLACVSLGILNNTGISPESLRTYRSDRVDVEPNEKKPPWPSTFQQHVKENIKQILSDMEINTKDTDRKNAVQLKEVMASSVFHLLTLINYRDHVFNVDVFKNPSELYNDFTKQNPERKVEKPGNELKHIKIKPLCGRNIFEGKMTIIQNMFARFHFNPVAFKRFFVTNALYYLQNENLLMDESIKIAPPPELVEIINGKAIVVEESPQYMCRGCGNVPFYERDGTHCLCFLLLKVVAALTDREIKTLISLKCVYDDYVKNVLCNFDFSGAMTSYKTLHNITINETQSSCGYFGKIQLKHTGKSNGFGVRKKTNNENTEVDMNNVEKQTMGSDVTEYVEQEKELCSYLETRKMEWVVKNVKSEMKKMATLGDPNLPENGEIKDSPLWSVQRVWLFSNKRAETGDVDSEDARCFVTGTKDDPAMTCSNAVLSAAGEIFPLLITDQPVIKSNVEPTNFDHGTETEKVKEKNKNSWEDDDDEDEDSKPKKIKSDYRAMITKKMECLIFSVLYKLLSGSRDEQITVDQIHHQHRDLVKKWNEHPKKYNFLFRKTMLKIIFGEKPNSYYPVDINDHQSLVARIVQTYLERLPPFISHVRDAVAQTLGVTPHELDNDFSHIVHYDQKIKREFVSWQDIGGTDTLNKRSTMLTLFEVIRHEVEARAANMVSEAQSVSKVNADSILRSKAGPYCRTVAGNVNIHVPIITNGDDGIPVLSISENPSENAFVGFDMRLPVKMKVSLNVTEMDENKLKKVKTETNATFMDYEDDYDEQRFIPRPLLNNAKTSKVPVIDNTPRPAQELIEILTDSHLLFTRVGETRFADITKNASTVQILCHYIQNRTNGKKVPKSHNLIIQGFFTMINRALEHILLQLKKSVSLLSNVVPGLKENVMDLISQQLMCDLMCMKILECAVHAVCMRNPRLTSAFYLFTLCSELYGPPCLAKDSNKDLERDSHAINAVVAGCLRLFVGSDDCNKTTRKADSRQIRLVPVLWTYLKGRQKPYVTMVDVSRRSASQIMLILQMGSYQSSYDSSSVFTTVRGGAAITRTIAPIMNSVVKTQIIEGEHTEILCRPLVWVSNKFVERGKENISTLIETYPLQVFIRYVLENQSLLPALLAHYSNFFSKSQEKCTEEDVWEACVTAHRISTDDVNAELLRTVILPKVFAVMTGCATHALPEENEEDQWTDSEEET